MKQVIRFMVCFFMNAQLCAMDAGSCTNAVYRGIYSQLPGQAITVRTALFSDDPVHVAYAVQEKEASQPTESLMMSTGAGGIFSNSENIFYSKRAVDPHVWKFACDRQGTKLAYASIGAQSCAVGIARRPDLQEMVRIRLPSSPRALAMLDNGSPVVSTISNGIVVYDSAGRPATLFDGDVGIPDRTSSALLVEKNCPYDSQESSVLHLYDIATAETVWSVRTHEKTAGVFAFSPDNKVVYAGTSKGNIILLPLGGTKFFQLSLQGVIMSIVPSRIKEHLVTAHRFNGVTDVYDVRNFSIPCHTIVPPAHDVCLTSIISAQKYLYGVSRTGAMHFWELQ